jgi:RNA polymerase sigma-70 factor (ECF subfamily)
MSTTSTAASSSEGTPACGSAPASRGNSASARLSSEAVRRIYLEHHSSLLRYVRRLLSGDPQRAEDIVQETVVRAWLNASGQPPGWEPTRAWLFTVARNLVVDCRRHDRARPQVRHEQALAAVPAPVDEVGRAIQRHFIVHALSRLSRPHREVLVYVYLLGCTGSDTADALGIPAGTVKSRTHHAMRELRRCNPRQALAA